jgi:hypothetical protein
MQSMFDFNQITGPEDSKQSNFSTLCSCLIMRLYPRANSVNGKGGDEGLDTYIGNIDGVLHAFQHKYFLNGLGSSQRRQIISSLSTVTRLHVVASWTLMLPADLTPAEQRWFNKLQEDYPTVPLTCWGKTRLFDLLVVHRDLAAAFQPAQPLTLVVLGKNEELPKVTLDVLIAKLAELGYSNPNAIAPAVLEKLQGSKVSPKLNVLIWGPSESDSQLYQKRLEIKLRIDSLGHRACFPESFLPNDLPGIRGLNLKITEYLQCQTFDYIICLMVSPGSIAEVHDFANKRDLACKMMVCIDQAHSTGYSSHGALQIFEGFNGRLDWFHNPIDLQDCHLATRILTQIEKTSDAKTWELLDRGNP